MKIQCIKRLKIWVTDWEKIFLKCISDKVILSKTYKELLNSMIRKQFNFLKMGQIP